MRFLYKLLYNIIGKLQLEERKLNIGIDIDGVLTDMEREITDYATKMCVEEQIPIKIDSTQYYESDSFDWNQEQVDKFWNKYLVPYVKEANSRKYAKEIIQELRKEEIVLDEMKIKILNDSNVTNIEENAKEKLNMDYPKDNQIRYIDLNN